jgi:hypothetical protein
MRQKKECALGSIESIIPKGTSKKVFEILNHRFHVVHSAHRWYSLDEKEQGVNQLHVIGGVGDCCLKAGMQYYGVTEKKFILISHHFHTIAWEFLGIQHPILKLLR